MDTSSTPRRTIRLLLDVTRTSDNRIEGQIATAGDLSLDPIECRTPFSGLLELLKVLEELA